jgi:hypothetical protein
MFFIKKAVPLRYVVKISKAWFQFIFSIFQYCMYSDVKKRYNEQSYIAFQKIGIQTLVWQNQAKAWTPRHFLKVPLL